VTSRILKLINEFTVREIAPVEIEDIVNYLRAQGIKDEVYFWDADMDTAVLRGAIVHWEYQVNGWTYKVADIYTARTLSAEEKRLVQAKELLHILDPRIDRASTPDEVEELIKRMALRASEVDWKDAEAGHARSDVNGILYALPVLFPNAMRDLFLAPLASGKIDIDRIAEITALPKGYVKFVMDDLWGAIYPGLLAHLASLRPVPDRIHTFDAASSPLDVISVPLEEDPYVYAKRVEEHSRGTKKPIAAVVVETARGSRAFSAVELTAYTQWNPYGGRKS